MHHVDTDETPWEKARWNLHKNATNKSWKQHSTKQQLYGHQPSISKIIQDEQDMQDTAGEARANKVLYGPLYMDAPVLTRKRLTDKSPVQPQDAV